ncbi:MAG: hypothetical protein HY720_12800, partial [Planctomycetes bacterium]|nr:hypothetical protein [Planctomycetota bacterium]
ASPEKALVDWLHLVEEECLDPRLEEIEWDALDLGRLEALCREAGVEPEPLLGQSRRLLETSHVQWRLRWEGAPPR